MMEYPDMRPHAVHTDLYDRMDVIPFEKMKQFFDKNL